MGLRPDRRARDQALGAIPSIQDKDSSTAASPPLRMTVIRIVGHPERRRRICALRRRTSRRLKKILKLTTLVFEDAKSG